MASRIALLPEKKMDQKNLRLAPWSRQQIQTIRLVERPKRRSEDDINDLIKPGDTKERKKYDLMNNKNWMMEAKNTDNGQKKKVYEKPLEFFLDRGAKRLDGVFCLNPSQTGVV